MNAAIRLLPLCLAAHGALADASGAAPAEATAREAALARRGQAIDVVARWHGVYRMVRDVYVEGPAGMVALSQRWLEESARWAQRAHAVVELVRASRGQLRDAATRARCREELRGLHDELATVQHLSAAAHARGAAAERQLRDLGDLPPAIVPDYDETTAFLQARRDELRAAVQALEAAAKATEQSRWERSLVPLARGIAAAARAEALLAPEMAAELAVAADAIAAAAVTYPHQLAVQRARDELQHHVLARRYFHARDAAVALTASRDHHVAAIMALDVDSTFQAEAVAAIDRMHAAGSSAWRALDGAAPAWQIVAHHLDRDGRALAAQCRDSATRAGRNCALLRQFIGMPAARLEQMGTDELELIERSLERVAAGPLS